VHDDDTFGPGFGLVQEVTAGGPGFVAVGQLCENPDAPCPGQPTVWVSETGDTWTRLPFLTDTLGNISDITSYNGTLIAVGAVSTESGEAAAVWTSNDGYTWQRIVATDAFNGEGNQWITGVTSSEDGIVAVGASWTPDQGTRGTVWFSPNGGQWKIGGSCAADAPATMIFEAVTTVGSQYVAAGTRTITVGPDNEDEIGEVGGVWTSQNGSVWTPIDTGDLFSAARLMVVAGNQTGVLIFANVPELTIWQTPPS
jgi:hypothetical protein